MKKKNKQVRTIHIILSFAFLYYFCILYAPFETITVSGTYVYGIDVDYNPTSANDTIIKISSSNVTLDLNGHTLNQTTGNTQAGLAGVSIDQNLTFVTVKNGMIRNITGKGIVVGAGCNTVALDSITTTSCDIRGVSFEGTLATPILGIAMTDCTVSGCCQGATGDYGVYILQGSGFQLTNVNSSGNGLLTHNVSSIRIENSTIGRLNNVTASSNFGATSVKGFEFINFNEGLMEECFSGSNGAFAPSATCVGFDLLSTCSALIFENANAFVNAAPIAGSNVFGFRLDTSNNDNSFTGCQSIDNSASASVTGFSCTSNQRNTIVGCVASKNSCITGTATGVLFNTCTANKIFFSRINENSSQNGIARGVDFSTCSECFMQDSIIARNVGSSAANSFGARITPAAPTGNNVVTKTIATRNGATAANQLVGFSGTQMNNNATDDVNTLQAWTNPALT